MQTCLSILTVAVFDVTAHVTGFQLICARFICLKKYEEWYTNNYEATDEGLCISRKETLTLSSG